MSSNNEKYKEMFGLMDYYKKIDPDEFTKEFNRYLALHNRGNASVDKNEIEKHLAIMKLIIESRKSCTFMGGRSKRSRRVKRSKRTRHTRL